MYYVVLDLILNGGFVGEDLCKKLCLYNLGYLGL